MHDRLSFLYDCNCDACKAAPVKATLAPGKFKRLLITVEKAFKRLHKNGKYSPDTITEVKEYADLINETATIFKAAITDNVIPDEMLTRLQDDIYLFSAFKTHAQLFEASRQLLTDEGTVKPFSAFAKDVATMKEDYNRTYLEAEYQFAVTSSQMAAKWAKTSDRYYLQYRTAKDDRVRESHQALDSITLPVDDSFWLYYYPPNGWRCRCNAVQVSKQKYEASNSETANKAGEAATTEIGKDNKNKLEIFRFNPGMQKVIFPPQHPYSKVKGAKQVKDSISNAN
ncbi:hypothetical protein GCM10007424_23660 [Flavobacterium suaedae]|uniref:Phage head morphogenesis domain-containing protein n=1 Tax=Flavobacterium suaedae TaxID=1767027 RepID=A0ABQ1K3L5_9FLAO|nr:phage minor head protein [Flavobacterium suaedae]GGB82901.1 hypothetical protein GCM10007424_23660 [Flavobacterium suaedae]